MPRSTQDRRIYAKLWQRFFSEAWVFVPSTPYISIMSPHFYNNHALPL